MANSATYAPCRQRLKALGRRPEKDLRQRYFYGYNQAMTLKIPARVAANCCQTPQGAAWLGAEQLIRSPRALANVFGE